MEENSKKLTNLDQIGEFGLIDSITKDFEIVNDTTELSVGDDAAILDYKSDKLKRLYNVVLTILQPDGELRLRSDVKKPAFWKYAKEVYFGITPYHMKAGVTASNYKYHKRKAGNKNKISMSFDEKGNPKSNTFRSLEDVRRIRDEMNYSDKQLRTLWRTVRKMIVEDGLR